MKLLFDRNLSPHLVEALAGLYPGSDHVRHFGLQQMDDEVVWNNAREHDFVIVSKDSDFRQRSFVFGFPPKVIGIRAGNSSTSDIEKILRRHQADVQRFCAEATETFLILF